MLTSLAAPQMCVSLIHSAQDSYFNSLLKNAVILLTMSLTAFQNGFCQKHKVYILAKTNWQLLNILNGSSS